MKINEIIKKRRNELELTQEQVAEYLGVSTPAVNKWEKGVSYPDITLLSPLARLLKVDLNTLLSFKDDLSEQEIGDFLNEIGVIISDKGFNIGFEKAIDKINEYPTCDKLIMNIALLLQGAMFMFEVKNKEGYEKHIEELFEKVLNSEDIEIRNQAISILINKHLEKKEYEKAQDCINKLPNITYDKEQQQGRLYIKLEKFDKACELFERKLISTTSEIFSILLFMMEIALKENRNGDAKYFAEVLEKTTGLYDLWEYNSYVAYLQLYTVQKDTDNCISILSRMLPAMSKKWDISRSVLYKHIKAKDSENDLNERFLSSFVKTLKSEEDNELSFLKGNKKFLELLNQYK